MNMYFDRILDYTLNVADSFRRDFLRGQGTHAWDKEYTRLTYFVSLRIVMRIMATDYRITLLGLRFY